MVKIEMDPDDLERMIIEAVEKATQEMATEISATLEQVSSRKRVIENGQSVIKRSL
jgi:hypothetical protein